MGEDFLVTHQFPAQVVDDADFDVFNDLGEDDESELVEREVLVVSFKCVGQFDSLQHVAFLHEFDHDEVSHVVVGEGAELRDHDATHHVEVELVLEVVDVVLHCEAELLVLPAGVHQVLHVFLLDQFVRKQLAHDAVGRVIIVDIVDLVFVDACERIHRVPQISFLAKLHGMERILGLNLVKYKVHVRVKYVNI